MVLIISIMLTSNVFATSSVYHTSLENEFGNIKTKLVHDGAILILNQTTQKLTYNTEENILVNTELINIGNKSVTISYCEPLTAFEVKNQAGGEVWPRSQIACIPEFTGKKTLQPGEHLSIRPYGSGASNIPFSPIIATPGNYTILSVAAFSFNVDSTNYFDSIESVWSTPMQITVGNYVENYVENQTDSSMEKIPEFPLVIPILMAGIMAILILHRMKSNFRT